MLTLFHYVIYLFKKKNEFRVNNSCLELYKQVKYVLPFNVC